MTIGEKIRRLLDLRGMTQADLAERAGITPGALSRYINGSRSPKAKTVADIARVLGVSSDYLLGIDEIKDIASEMPTVLEALDDCIEKRQIELLKQYHETNDKEYLYTARAYLGLKEMIKEMMS